MTFSSDTVVPTTMSGTTEQRLNTDTPLQVPDGISTITELTPYYCPVGVFTADQSYVTRFRVQSNDISTEPARFMMSVVSTGDAAFASVQAPALKSYGFNIPNANGANVNYYAQSMVTNATETFVGVEVTYSTNPTGSQQYWQTPDSISTGSATINTRNSGNSITITDGQEITSLNCIVAPTTSGASTHICGEFEFQSSDFNVPFPYKIAVAPSFTGLGAAAGMQTNPDGQSGSRYPAGQGIPLAPRCLINTFYTNRDGVPAGSSFMGFVSFTK